MMEDTTIWFETHSTSIDNEAGLASGHFDVELSDRGRGQAAMLGARYRDREFAAVYTSDLKRALDTATIAFTGRPVSVISDARLRECDYGDLSRCPVEHLQSSRCRFIEHPFPGGESYRDVLLRVGDFLSSLTIESLPVLIIGHRATWYAFEVLLRRRDLNEVIRAPWQWQPGWTYTAPLRVPG